MKSFTQSAIAKFVAKFLSDNGSEELVEKWNAQENIEAFNNVAVKTRRSSDKIKDPNKPKRGLSAYILFCRKKREEAKAKLGDGAKATEVTSELGLMWNDLKASTKSADKKLLASLVSEAAEDKARYTMEMEGYVAPSEEELATMVSPKKARKTSDKDPNAPKRGSSAYIFFCSAMRPQVKEELGEEGKSLIMSELGKRWKELKEDEDRSEELAVYTKMAVDDKARYEDEKENGKATEPAPKKSKKAKPKKDAEESDEEETPAPKPAPKKKSKKDAEESDEEETPAPKKKPKKDAEESDDESEEEKPASKKQAKKKTDDKKESPKKKTGYVYFSSLNREGVKEDNPDMKPKDLTRELARMWKELSKDEKKAWNDSVE